jgi:hypothetical protein
MPKATDLPTTIRPSSLEHAHRALIAHLANARPVAIRGTADAADVLNRTEHIQQVYAGVIEHLEEILSDTMAHLDVPEPVDEREVELAIWDAVNVDPDYDVIAWLARAGCHLGLVAAA